MTQITKEQAYAALSRIAPNGSHGADVVLLRLYITQLEAQRQPVGDEKLREAVDYLRSALSYRPEVGEEFDFEGAAHLTTVLNAVETSLSELETLRSEVALKTVVYADYRKGVDGIVDAARGLSFGEDWNNGTHAKIYRHKLIEAVKSLPTPPAQEEK